MRVRGIGSGIVGFGGSMGLLLLGGCSSADQEQIRRLAMPVEATDRAPLIYDLWVGSWIAAIAVGVVVWGLILYASFRFRRRSDDEVPVQTRYNLPIEILYTVAPVVMVLVLLYETIETQNQVLERASEESPALHTVNVVGAKWAWTFNYMGEDAVNGQTVHTVGTPADLPTLMLPVGEKVRIRLSSPDVIHPFWVPSFLFKLDVIPGQRNTFEITPTKQGEFKGKCAELCGQDHARMLFNVEVVPPEKFDTRIADLKARNDSGSAQ